ncbi:transcriptional regulator ClgR [Mycolicibacterium thermoresistibile]|jgi:transcriptional regulator with XRE-family HTH domain|uniref:XRE family transcriptional regulator n=2 Tax=Mycolicibacterium thermoresistibile TaxID=1797 RepID=G7CIF8_MYCT3|nr:transcriptional regulator ClgR [Mycolicibacterium thermoresistibile]EHI12565.1 XRE family transcriptional regulator [Mycolicibacterium thermoresistibile ATCC 19527]MCV7190170.1 helix-turn-helix transcriptional regulator [Mycolicibacterium thermoresistibile]GAT13771.1 XRE family transcriptional regulator [Mycolicibacterium thermoresistibile]SNW18944.1 XRE family transcriptional regulator [Mycolicibacterium thermoresistibile]
MAALLREVVGDVLRRARIEQGRTLREVSDSARVSLGYLSEVERGRKEASSELLSAICAALDVPLWRVLTDAGAELARDEAGAELVGTAAESARDERETAASAGSSIDVTTKVVIPQPVSMAVA